MLKDNEFNDFARKPYKSQKSELEEPDDFEYESPSKTKPNSEDIE